VRNSVILQNTYVFRTSTQACKTRGPFRHFMRSDSDLELNTMGGPHI